MREHTNRLNLKLVAQNYNSDPAAVARDAVLYATSHKTDCVLIDTAGRMQTSKNLMEQIAKITKVVNPDVKIFVGDSLAGNDTVNQAREFFEHVKFDGSILTKVMLMHEVAQLCPLSKLLPHLSFMLGLDKNIQI